MITLEQYYMGRDKTFGDELTPELRLNAREMVRRANMLLAVMIGDGVEVETMQNTESIVSSGWRPAAINKSTPKAAVKSNHMTCHAIDVYDPHGAIDDWCMDNPDKLAWIEIWIEHPSATKGWSHWQMVPPRSGKRVFYP
jgi:hypothetical protein